jgi:hypothetical protein
MEKQWAEMTWQERREDRFKKWLDTTGTNFSTNDGAEKFKKRATP